MAEERIQKEAIYIAVCGGDRDAFYWDIKENVHSLLSFDVVFLDKSTSKELMNETDELLLLIRDSFTPAFCVLESTLKDKLAEAEEE